MSTAQDKRDVTSTKSQLLWEVVLPPCSRDEAGDLGEALYTLSDYLERHHPDATITGVNKLPTSPEDKSVVHKALTELKLRQGPVSDAEWKKIVQTMAFFETE